MAQWAAKDRLSGAVMFVSDENYDPELWELTVLAQAPAEHDDFVGGKLVRNKDRETKARKKARAASVSREDLLDMIEDLQRRVAALETK